MKIAVIAANGRAGQAFVRRALAMGHQVRGGIRGESHLPRHACLTLVPCDATNIEDIRKLITGQEAVVSLIGHIKGSSQDVQTIATKNVVEVMREQGVKRLVSLTGTGARLPGDKVTLLDHVLNLGVRIADPARVRDGRRHMEVLRGSGLDWTVIRVLKLQNVPPRPYELTPHGPTKPYVGRAEVAAAILEVLDSRSFIKEAPIISKPGVD